MSVPVHGELEEPRLGLLRDIVDELRWTLSGRRGWLVGMGVNLIVALAYLSYQRFDPTRRGDLRIANLGIAVVVWTLADVVNTNQLGSDADRVLASLEDNDRPSRILAIKNLSLAVILVPIAVAISLIVHVLVDRWRFVAHALIIDFGSVFLWLGAGCVVSVLLPYPPISLRQRWRVRRKSARWVLCQAVPYGLAFIVMPVLHLPYWAIYHTRLAGAYQPHFLVYSCIYLVLGLLGWLAGLTVASWYARSHRQRFLADLRRPQ